MIGREQQRRAVRQTVHDIVAENVSRARHYRALLPEYVQVVIESDSSQRNYHLYPIQESQFPYQE
jgi:hypothetical protein